MSQPPIDAIVAGTKAFAVSLLAPLAQRVGGRPRIAADAAQALALCAGSARGLIVIEVQDAGSVGAIERLARAAAGVRVVAAVPLAHAAAEATLRALGVEPARWDGHPGPVLEAVDRKLAAAAAAPPPPRAAAPAPPAQPAAAAAPAPARAAAPAPAAAPARAAAPAPAAAPARAAGPAPAAAAARPAAPAPAAPARSAAPAPAPAAAPVPARPSAPAPAAAPAPARSAAPAPRPAVPVEPTLAAAAHPAGATLDAGEDVELDFDLPEPAAAPAWSAPPAAAPTDAPAPWPTEVPDADAAEAALSASLAGTLAADAPFADVVEQVLAAVSNLERAVLFGDAQPFDAAPVRRAAVTRLRVAIALATAPPAGAPSDPAAVGAILGEIDALLPAVSALAAAAPPERQRELGAVRNALVKEAIDFAEAAQRVATSEAPAPAPVAAPRAAPRASATRVLTVDAAEAPRRSVVRWVFVGIVILAFVGYHGQRYLERRAALAKLGTIAGAPEGMVPLPAGRSGVRILVPVRGKVPDPAQLEQFKAKQRAAGYEVRERPGGSLEIRPPPAAASGSTR